ncbi:retinol dehydrogenase 12-like isoform X2 [Stegodyphus dumicola]|uniref:retinol dehydrogenase 12-like isoform X2 n=1 Tax=Stegodyphus dumicola TaxID=202533 RepID=UPI0015AD07E0|nr:retinol dehydrogenase 12-like isoform X2 [Stegodyphus dumicola]
MVKRGARVLFTYNTEANATETLTYIFKNVPTADVSAKYLNLASFSSIYKFANEILENEKKIHILMNNAVGKIDFNDLNLDHHYNVFYAYGRSKLCNILFTRELAKRLQGSKVSTYSLHPAAAQTNIDRDKDSADRITRFLCAVLKPLFLDPGNCISTILYCSLEESIEDQSGSYYCDCTKVEPFLNAKDDKLASDLWNLTEELISQKKIINSVTTEKKDL